MTSNAQMNGKSASSGVESMNRANMKVRKKTAVDALNAMLVLLNNTKDCYKKQVDGVSGDINYDLGAEIGEKLEEYAEEPV
jgi:hypothetical protein